MTFAITYLLFVHYVGDFVLQTDNMALNKSKSLKWLSIHVLTYLAVLSVACIIYFNPVAGIKFAMLNAALHWITDYFTSKMNAKLYQRESKRLFFIGVGFDQFIHSATLIITYHYLMA